MKKTERKKIKKIAKQIYKNFFKSATTKQPIEPLSIVDEIKLEKLKKGENL